MDMENKEKIDTYLKLLEITQVGFEGRRSIEWTVLGLLWTGILVSTGFLYDKGITLSWELCGSMIAFVIGLFIWLGFLARANEIDKDFRNYYRGMVNYLLQTDTKPNEPKDVEKRLKKPKLTDKWQIVEFFITITLMTFAIFILKK